MKPKLFKKHGDALLVTSTLLLIGVVALFIVYSNLGETEAVMQTVKRPAQQTVSIDGEYVYSTRTEPLTLSSVTVTNGTKNVLSYAINIHSHGKSSTLEGNAYRNKATSTPSYSSRDFYKGDFKEGCRVTIVFVDKNHIYYEAEDTPGVGTLKKCSDYFVKQSSVSSHILHEKATTETLPSLLDFGFTKEDRVVFETLDRRLTSVELFIRTKTENEHGDVSSSSQKIISTDIPGSFGYRIEFPSGFDNKTTCDFKEGHGICDYGAYIKDIHGGYFAMHGHRPSQGVEKLFWYRTTEPEWKKKLPEAFKRELVRFGVTEDDVDFEQ